MVMALLMALLVILGAGRCGVLLSVVLARKSWSASSPAQARLHLRARGISPGLRS